MVVGASNFLRNKVAFLADIADAKVKPHWHASIVLARNWLLVHPRGDKISWQGMLNNLAATTPETCITAVKWRKSCKSGRP